MKRIVEKVILCLLLLSLSSCKGIEFENQKIAKAEEFSKAEAMIFVAEEKNRYENRFGNSLWNLKSGDGSLYFKDYIVSVTKGFIEKLMILKLTAEDLNVIISNADSEKITKASEEYYNLLTYDDKEYIGCAKDDVLRAFTDYHIARLVVDNLSKNASTELSISEAKVIRVQYIVFEEKEIADQTVEDLKNRGANFAYFAKTRGKNTDIEMIIKRGDEMSTRFPELFYLSDGQVSDVIQFRNRYYLFKCVEDYMVDETEERRLEVLKSMKNHEFKEKFERYENEYKIRSNSSYWKEIDLQDGRNCTVNNFEEIYYRYFPKTIK
ncbi:MAG: hypothetical protein J6P02_05125 [Lachnospiraceae bacterium]|nr:hypothetical protein [Lachnospiraceae bacterium]